MTMLAYESSKFWSKNTFVGSLNKHLVFMGKTDHTCNEMLGYVVCWKLGRGHSLNCNPYLSLDNQ